MSVININVNDKFERLDKMVKEKNKREIMNALKNMNTNELLKLINNTEDPDILDAAESEYLRKLDNSDQLLLEGFDDDIDSVMEELKRTWRPR